MIGTTKNIVGNGAMALGCQKYIRRNNNQLTADVFGTSDMREEGRRVGHVGGCHPIAWGIKLRDKKKYILVDCCIAHRCRCSLSALVFAVIICRHH